MRSLGSEYRSSRRARSRSSTPIRRPALGRRCAKTHKHSPTIRPVGNCAGAAVSSAFVNYQTGDYQVTFTTAPRSGHAITASWTNIISPENVSSTTFSRPQGLDQFGDGGAQSGFVSSQFARLPGGVNGQIWASQGTDNIYMFSNAGPAHLGYEIRWDRLFADDFVAI